MRSARPRPRRRRGVRLALPPLAALLLVSCFEPPVHQTVELEFLADATARIGVRVEIRPLEARPGGAALERRVDELRQALAAGRDEWSRRFAAISASREAGYWEKEGGELTRFERHAVVDDPQDLTRFFADAGVSVFYEPAGSGGELSLYPGTAQRASRQQRRRVAAALDEWVEQLVAYARAAEALYAYLETRPERAAVCFGAIFDDLVVEDAGEPDAAEEALLEPLYDAMVALFGALEVEAGEEYSLDELTQLVYDPFPATVEVRLPSPAVEHEGFRRHEEAWVIAPTGLWTALADLEGRWVEPDLLLIYVEKSRAEEPVDLADLSLRSRRVERPAGAAEVRRLIEERLEPEPAYRLRW